MMDAIQELLLMAHVEFFVEYGTELIIPQRKILPNT